MRLLITAVVSGEPHDLAVDVEDTATVGDLAGALGDAFGVPSTTIPTAARPVLRVAGSGTQRIGPPPSIYLEESRLPAEQPLSQSEIRHACVIGVGGPVSTGLVEPVGVVEIRIASGPGAGSVVRLGAGEFSIGASPDCDVVLDDPDLPPVCARVRVGADAEVSVVPDEAVRGRTRPAPSRRRPLEGPIVLATFSRVVPKKRKQLRALPQGTVTVEPQDDIPLLHRDREAVVEETVWAPGQVLAVGHLLLQLAISGAPDASLSLNPGGATLDFNRPPRLLPPIRETSFSLPQEPKEPEKPPFPLAMILAPTVMGLAMFWIMKTPTALLFCLMSPMMAVGNFTSSKRQGRVRYRNELQQFAERTDRIQKQAFEALVEERTARRRDCADPAEVMLTAVGPRARLWERRPSDPDFLLARVGTADQASEVRMSSPSRESHEGALAWTAPDVPVTVSLGKVGVTGLAGPRQARMALARWLIAQLAVLHSPADLDMVLLGDASGEHDWKWVRWLPHMRSDIGDSELAHVGVDEESTARRINELHQEMQARVQATSGPQLGGRPVSMQPVLVILDGSRRLRLVPGVAQLLQAGPSVQMFFLCLDEDERQLPEEAQAIIDAARRDVSVRVSGEGTIEGVRPDLVSVAWAERVARSVAPIRDVSDVAAGGSLPSSSRLLEVIRLDPATSQGVLQRWQSVGRTTEAIIGEGADGPFAIDIRRDGPHGLVAGTTGSGKSELLQTIIASLAVNNRPDEMNYVLVDYKGGAAFMDCNNLPHTVGMVTDLDGHLTTRALESLGAELRRREHQLAAAQAKDIEDYLAEKGPDDEPMPRLLIVIDEFAALVAELPDFVTGLVDIARRGRSLGVHLILATQRPAGVVSAEIKSNTNLRIALRVTDTGDSADVLESPEAAHIAKSTPGRGYARLGHSSLIAFQTARVGGRPRGENHRAEVALRAVEYAALGTPEEKARAAEEDTTVPTDLAAFVAAARQASEESGIVAPPSPWLPAMAGVITLEALLAQFPAAVPSHDHLVIPFGMADVPAEQRRDVASFDIARGSHLAVVSAPRAGRSMMLRAIAGAIGKYTSPADVHVYGVDCGNNALLPLVGLPHVGAVVSRDQTDRMERLITRLNQTISERQQALAIGGFADITEQRANVADDQKLPYLVILFDRWEGFYQAYDSLDGGRLVTAWQQILQEGAAVGIKVIMTGDRGMLVGRMSTLVDDKLVMRMVDPTDFGNIGLVAKKVPSSMTEGRGFRAEGLRETQVVVLAEDTAGTAQVAALQQIGRDATKQYADLNRARRPFRLDVLPVRITKAEADALDAEELGDSTLVLGVGGDNLTLRTLDAFEHGPAILVTGPRRTGRSTALRTMATYALATGWQVVVVTPRLSPLRDLCSRAGVHGPFDETSDQAQVGELFEELRAGTAPVLVLVDDVELVGADGWLPTLLGELIDKFRDTGSVLAAAATPAEMGGMYRGPAVALKRSGSGLMLSPQSSTDTDMFGARLARSAMGATLPPGGGFLVRASSLERIQVIWPE